MTRVRRIADLIETPKRPPKKRPSGRRPLDARGRPVRARKVDDEPTVDVVSLVARLAIALGCFALLAFSWIQPIRSVEVRGVHLAPKSTIVALLEGEVGQRWATAPVDQLEAALTTEPWIDEVSVTRAPGARLVVDVHEAQPVLRLLADGHEFAVDGRGRLLPSRPALDLGALPRLEGVRVVDGELHAEDRARAVAVLEALQATPWAWAGGILEVDLADADAAGLRTGLGVELVFDVDRAASQLRNAGAAWAEVAPQAGDQLDLRFERQIVVRQTKNPTSQES